MTSSTANMMNEAALVQWDAAAEGWDGQSAALHAWLSEPTRLMLDLAGVKPGHRVLDVAAGAGEQTLALAERVGSQGSVLATDLSPHLIELLQRNAATAAFRTIEARVADAQMPLADTDAFDAAICRLGLMLMPEPALCLSSVYEALKPGGRFSAMVFAEPEANPCIRMLMATALRHAGVPPRDPFTPGGLLSLGRPGHMDQLFLAAGFHGVSTFQTEAPFRLPSVDEYITFLRAAAAPVIALLARLTHAEREATWLDVREQLAVFSGPQGWVGPNSLLLTTGER